MNEPSPVESPSESPNAETVQVVVRRSDDSVTGFDARRIVESLRRETGLRLELAQRIAQDIEAIIQHAGLRRVTSSLLRTLVDAKLIEYGLDAEYRAYSRLGLPLADIDRLIKQASPATSLLPLTPEGTGLEIAAAIKREYALLAVFSAPVAEAHLVGDIFIQDLGAVDRPYAIIQSPDVVKRHGFALPNRFTASRPARHPEVLVAHMVKSAAALQGYVNGAVEWDAVNFSLAPYLEDLGERELLQVAEALMFELSALSVGRGGNTPTCVIHLDWQAPAYLAQRPAIGPGGNPTGKTYQDYTCVAQRFLRALFAAYRDGDGQKLPLSGLRLVQHITPEDNGADWSELITDACRAVLERGNVWFVFDHTPEQAFLHRYGLPYKTTFADTTTDEWCAAAFQAVAINLPRATYRACPGKTVEIFEELTRLMDIAAQAHLEKRVFLEKLLARGEDGPLALLTARRSGRPFLRLHRTTHRLCPVGLDDLAQAVTGYQLHESPAARDFGAQIIAHLLAEAVRLTSRHKTHFTLAESHTEGMAERFTHMDARFFLKTIAESYPPGDLDDERSYVNGAKLSPAVALPPRQRAQWEGEIQRGSILNATTDIWLGEQLPTPEQLAQLIADLRIDGLATGLMVSPEFTLCRSCGYVAVGSREICMACNSHQVETLAKATNRYSRVLSWSPAAQAERRRRARLTATDF
ncbi:MAG: anaerobic ribonucleoside-triphosphate reductase [Acidobacteriota bacterium]